MNAPAQARPLHHQYFLAAIATVVTVKEDSVSVRSADSKFEITKGAIAEIRERSGEASSSSAS